MARIWFDGQEAADMRKLVPSLRKAGKCMSMYEVSDMLGVEPETIAKWERQGAPMWLKYAYDGLKMNVQKHLGQLEQITDMPLSVEDRLSELDRKKKALIAFEKRKAKHKAKKETGV